jgi:hypothetical protein
MGPGCTSSSRPIKRFQPALFDQIVGTLRFDPALLEAQFLETTPSF